MATVALDLTSALLMSLAANPPSAGQLAFLRTLMRMQTLHCLARALALSTARMLPGGRAADPEEAALRTRMFPALLRGAMGLLTILAHLGGTTAKLPPQQPGPATSAAADKERRRVQVLQRVCAGELVSALADSGIVEHLARAVLVETQLAGEPDATDRLAERVLSDHGGFISFQIHAGHMAQAAPPLGSPAAAARLNASLQHPCVLHLQLTSGLAALCLADGGTSHGMPQTLLDGTPVLTCAKGADGALEAPDVRGLHGRQSVAQPVVVDFVACLPKLLRQPHDPPALRPSAAASLLLRVGRWAVASGRAWADPEPELQPQPQQAAGAGAGGAAPPPLELLVGRGDLHGALQFTLLTLDSVLTEAGLGATGGWAWRAAVRRWGLVVQACRHVLPVSIDTQVEALAELWSPLSAHEPSGGLSGALPPEPPAQVAAALAAGLLPCLERLLRRGGEDPLGSEAELVAQLLNLRPDGDILLARLLAYGKPSQAAALVTSFAKLLRRAEHSADTFSRGMVFAASVLHTSCSFVFGPGPSAAHPQLKMMMLLSAAEWLPPLARLAQAAAVEAAESFRARKLEVARVWLSFARHAMDSLRIWIQILLPGQIRPGADGGWRRFVLEELQVLPLLGSLLRSMDAWSAQPGTAADTGSFTNIWHNTACLCTVLALAAPAEVRQATQMGAAAEAEAEAAAADARAGSGRGPRRGRGGAKGAKDGGPAAFWPPETLESLGRAWGTGSAAGPTLETALVTLLRQWATGDAEADVTAACLQGLSDKDEWRVDWGPLPPLASVRALLPSCAHPRCTRLDGDSEAGRELRRYPVCGEGAYCSGACAQEHGAAAGAGGSGARAGKSGELQEEGRER